MGAASFARAGCPFLALALVAACGSEPMGSAEPSPSAARSAQQASPSEPSAGGAAARPPDLSAYGEHRLKAGRYVFVAYGTDPEMPLPAMKVPEGFRAFGGFSVGAVDGPGFAAVMVWTVDIVYREPCGMSDGMSPGQAAQDLVDALARQKGTSTSDPRPVELGGQQGVYVEVTASDAVAQCDGQFTLWSDDGYKPRYLQAPGQVDRLWVLDTPGERLVIDATHTPQVSDQDVRRLLAIARSVRFVPPAP